ATQGKLSEQGGEGFCPHADAAHGAPPGVEQRFFAASAARLRQQPFEKSGSDAKHGVADGIFPGFEIELSAVALSLQGAHQPPDLGLAFDLVFGVFFRAAGSSMARSLKASPRARSSVVHCWN